MEKFIQEHISIINKNNILVITIGTKSQAVFNTKLDTQVVDNFISKLYSRYPHIKKFRVDTNKKIYKHKNTITEVDNNNYDNYSYIVTESKTISENEQDFKLNVIKKLYQDECVPSLYKFHYIENLEEYNIDINNLFNVIVTNSKCNEEEWFSVKIEIKKPNNYKKIYNKILSIINMI